MVDGTRKIPVPMTVPASRAAEAHGLSPCLRVGGIRVASSVKQPPGVVRRGSGIAIVRDPAAQHNRVTRTILKMQENHHATWFSAALAVLLAPLGRNTQGSVYGER
jgi:hypothetical protein